MKLGASTADLPWAWGSGLGTSHAPQQIPGTDVRLAARAVLSTAPPKALYLWLCQLRRSPYSYDWIDNFGRVSPVTPDASLTALETGQIFMTIFRLKDFTEDRELVISMRPGWPTRLFGAITVRYSIVPYDPGRWLLRGDLYMPRLGRPVGGARRYLLAWGDLLMMRKQLRTLSARAQQTAADPDA